MIIGADTVKGSLAGALYKEDELGKRKDEKGEITYNHKEVEFICQNQMFADSAQARYSEMKSIANLNTSCKNKFVEVFISPDKTYSRDMSSEDWKKLAQDYTAKLGVPHDQQWYAVKHGGDDPHMHLLINRIGFDGKNKIPSQNIGERSGRIADELAKERNWKNVKELMAERYQSAKNAIDEATKTARNFDELTSQLKEKGFVFTAVYNSKGLNGGRICPVDEWKEFSERSNREKAANKGYTLSEINKGLKIEKKPEALKIKNIEQKLNHNNDEHRRTQTKNTAGDFRINERNLREAEERERENRNRNFRR